MHVLWRVWRIPREHLFLHCRFCKNFWMQIVSWLNDLNITIIELKDSEIMLGYMNESPHWLFLNHVLIIGKQVIYSSRLSKSKPLFSQFKVKLKHIERIEYYIARKRDRCSFNEKKWKIINEIIFKFSKLSCSSENFINTVVVCVGNSSVL